MFECLNNTRGDSFDVIICSVPYTETDLPLMAPATLKPIVEKAGLSCLAVDLNIEVTKIVEMHPQKEKFIKFFYDGVLDQSIEQEVYHMLQTISTMILKFQPSWVGLSLLSYASQKSALWISYFIKKIHPSVKIIIGGPGCLSTFVGPSSFVNELLDSKIVDYHVRGDGENSLYELLTGNEDFDGINKDSWKELSKSELEFLPIPDYSDYNFDFYESKVLPIIGSRGCVRKCTFCDYIANWKKFQWRTAENIFEEMLVQHQLYGINRFKFQDSLINGALKEFRRLTELIANHNENNPDNAFKWSSFYIFRDRSSSDESDWDLIARSGAEILLVGIENVNEHIRYSLGKKFSNESIDYHLAQAKKRQIKLILTNIVGYINETREDIEFIKKWLYEHTEYKDILMIQWGGTLGIFPDTYLEKNRDSLGIKMIGDGPQYWVNNTTGSTPEIRASWAKELIDLSKSLGYWVFNNSDNHYLLESMSNGKFKKL